MASISQHFLWAEEATVLPTLEEVAYAHNQVCGPTGTE